MVRDQNASDLKNTQYSLAVNVNTESSDDTAMIVSLEPSNYFGIAFPSNYKVIGFETDILKNRTYYFLTSTILDTNSVDFKRSSIGYVDNNAINNINYNNEEETNLNTECDTCGNKAFNPLTTELETVNQIPSLTYTELVNDKCLDVGEGFNFNINFPIKKIEINQEKLGTTLYWNDNNNPSRYINISNLEEKGNQNYLFELDEPCEDITYGTCIDVDKLLVHPKHNRIVLEPSEEQTGGNLKMGTYEFWAAYCDLAGNEMTQYSTPTNPISIFDENNSIAGASELNGFTNFAIKIKVKNLDTKHFKYYKVAVVERNTVADTQSVFLTGIYPTTDDTIIYAHSRSSNDDLYLSRGSVSVETRMDFNTLNAIKPNWKKAKFTMVSGDILWHGGLVAEEELNIQPVLNLFGGLLHWQTSAASENLYKSAIATSKYKAYTRNEVQPFGIRLLYKNGGYSATFPLVGRPAIQGEKDLLISDTNLESLNANASNCSTTERDRRWQVYNTAYGYDETCVDIEDSSITTEETVNKICTIENIYTIPTDFVIINIDEDYSDFETYLEDNEVSIIQDAIDDTYTGDCIPTYVGDCDTPLFVSEHNEVGIINNKLETLIPKELENYLKSIPPTYCAPYKRADDGEGFANDATFVSLYMNSGEKVYIRDSTFYNETCGYADSLAFQQIPSQSGTPIFLNYAGSPTEIGLLQNSWSIHPTTIVGDFKGKLHAKAQFFKVDKQGKNKVLFEITKTSPCPSSRDNLAETTQVRFTIYDSCAGANVLAGGIVDLTTGSLINVDDFTFALSGIFLPNTFLIAIDSPLQTYVVNPGGGDVTVHKVIPPCGCFSMYIREVENDRVNVTWDSIEINKIQEYTATCTFKVPKVNGCNIVPYKKGVMAYWESTETYDDNKQLWDSSELKIVAPDLDYLSEKDKEEFISYYTTGFNSNGVYNLKNADFRCQPIRHPKFPDNTVAPYIIDNIAFQKEADSIIFPLGVELDSNVIKTAISIAYSNKLITKEQRDNIKGYEILRGDNSISKSVIANGIAFDFYNYEKNDETIHFSNFPFNDLGKNNYCLTEKGGSTIDHPYNSDKNHLYSFLSPDVFLTKPSIPTEVLLQGFVMGTTSSEFTATDKHSEWTVLGRKAKKTAETLAIAEVALEFLLKSADLTAQQFFVFGLSSGASLGLVGAGIAAAAGLAQGVMLIGKYRYDWLKTFRDLGRTYNFANIQTASANYNKFIKGDQYSNEYLRKLTIGKYLREGDYTFVDEGNAKQIKINNWQREESVLLSTGEAFPFNYSTYSNYTSYDNNKKQGVKGSNFVASEINAKENTVYQRNVASPYFTLKNYIPDQWGKIDSIKWLTTNYIFDIEEVTVCKPIYGGTTYISRFSWKRKTPIFRKNAIKLADKLPFMYSRYENIGFPRFYCNYELDDGDNMYKGFLGLPFPDIDSEAVFDSSTGNNSMYYKPPSKMYTSVHGVVNFLVESEINCNFRYEGLTPKEWFYPRHTNLTTWLQETTLPISEPNTFYYNNTYSIGVSNTPYKFLDKTYDKEVFAKRTAQPNTVIWSQKDVSETDFTNSWLVYKPGDWYEFKTNNGKLIDMHSIESSQFLARFENKLALHNAIDTLSEKINAQNREFGTAGIFNQRPIEFKSTDLGFMGTQHTDIISTPYGHFWIDALRGKIFKLDQNGGSPEIISEYSGNQPSGMKQWFREHLHMKILKSLPNIDIDNKYKGIGFNMWFDDRESRLFITKRDYIFKGGNLNYNEEIGLYVESGSTIKCEEGYTYNEETQLCEREIVSLPLCPIGYTYDLETTSCILVETIDAECVCTADVIGSPQTICSGSSTSVGLTSTEAGIGFTWTVIQTGVTGATSGAGNTISQTLNGAGTAVYTVTPYEIVGGCQGTPVQITATVNALPNVIATPSSLSISGGDTAIINLTSGFVGTTFSWTVINSGTSGATSGSGNTISQVITGSGTTTYTITPSLNGCTGVPINVVVTVASAGIPCGGSVTANGSAGYYEVNAIVGTNTGTVEVTFNALSVPDRFQIIWNGNIVADSLFVGDALPNTFEENGIINVTNLNKYLYNGSTFNANGTIAVDYSASDIANSTGSAGTLRSVGNVGAQIGVVPNYPTPTAKASDGDIKLTFNKTTATPTNITIVSIGVDGGTAWQLVSLTCP